MTAEKTASIVQPNDANGIPHHVAIIMDGNGRWAEDRGLDVSEGHEAGFENLKKVVDHLGRKGVGFLTLYAFSTENWDRPEAEVNGILELAISVIAHEAQQLHENNVRIRHLGRVDRISEALRDELKAAVDLTASNTGLTLGVAFDYGGRAEIAHAARRMIEDGIEPGEIDEDKFAEYLYSAGMPDVDLLIRTGGDLRISNFMLWQSAYAEFYSTPVWWPDFHGDHIDQALEAFSGRKRRFGKRV